MGRPLRGGACGRFKTDTGAFGGKRPSITPLRWPVTMSRVIAGMGGPGPGRVRRIRYRYPADRDGGRAAMQFSFVELAAGRADPGRRSLYLRLFCRGPPLRVNGPGVIHSFRSPALALVARARETRSAVRPAWALPWGRHSSDGAQSGIKKRGDTPGDLRRRESYRTGNAYQLYQGKRLYSWFQLPGLPLRWRRRRPAPASFTNSWCAYGPPIGCRCFLSIRDDVRMECRNSSAG